MAKRRENSIPIEYREAVYYLGLKPEQIVSVRCVKTVPMTFAVVLKKGGLKWSGHIEAPLWNIRPPVTDINDLINNTMDCPTCSGSGKVKKGE